MSEQIQTNQQLERKLRLLKTIDEAIASGDVDVMDRMESAVKTQRWLKEKQGPCDKDCS